VAHGKTVGVYVPLNATGTETAGLTVLTSPARFADVLRARAFADKSDAVRTMRKMLARKKGKLARTRADVEREFDFIMRSWLKCRFSLTNREL
jgi:hypothetical protein